MFCPNCGEKLPDGSKFCGMCGTNLTELDLQPEVSAPIPVHNEEEAAPAQPNAVQPKKKINRNLVVGIGAVVIIALVVVLGLSALFSSSNSDNAYVYMSGGDYMLIPNLKKNTTIEIASSKSDHAISSLLSFSPDGKYVYYFTKYDNLTATGTLCRAEYAKLKEKSGKNDNYIEVIATNVSLGFRILDDGTVLYTNGDSTLYYYDGKTATQIDKSVGVYYTDESGRIIYSSGTYNEGYTLYGVTTNDPDNKIKLASNYHILYSVENFDSIVYSKLDDNYNETLYAVGFNKDTEKLGSDAVVYAHNDGKVYFTADSGEKLSLYDYVEDTYAEADAALAEPNIEDYPIPVYSYEMIVDSEPVESDYTELYTSCTKNLYWYGMSRYWCYSMEEALNNNWGDNTEALVAATQSFIDQFADQADENGYIRVTDEVKAALKELNTYGDNPTDNNWLWLCFDKVEAYTDYDYDAFYADCDVYYAAESRIEMREALHNSENDYTLENLYCYDNGTLSTISEKVLECTGWSDVILFNTADMVTEKRPIEEVHSLSDVRTLFNMDYEQSNRVVTTCNATLGQLSEDAAQTINDARINGSISLFATKDYLYLDEYGGALSAAPISGGTVGSFEILSDDATVLKIVDDTLYCAYGMYANNSNTYCDYYTYTGTKSTCIAADVMLQTVNQYSDKKMLCYTDGRSGYGYGYELSMIDAKGEKTIVADDVTQYVRVDDSTLLYISDGDLYNYDGKERKLLRTDADLLWVLNPMEITNSFGSEVNYYG